MSTIVVIISCCPLKVSFIPVLFASCFLGLISHPPLIPVLGIQIPVSPSSILMPLVVLDQKAFSLFLWLVITSLLMTQAIVFITSSFWCLSQSWTKICSFCSPVILSSRRCWYSWLLPSSLLFDAFGNHRARVLSSVPLPYYYTTAFGLYAFNLLSLLYLPLSSYHVCPPSVAHLICLLLYLLLSSYLIGFCHSDAASLYTLPSVLVSCVCNSFPSSFNLSLSASSAAVLPLLPF